MSAELCGCDLEARHICSKHMGRRAIMADAWETASAIWFDIPAPQEKEQIHTDPATGGQKGRKLARFSLLPWDVLWLVAEHFGRGAQKYEDRNWEKGYPWSWSYDAVQRHLAAFWHREEYGEDPKFGQFLHIVAVAWHALVLAAFAIRQRGTDDRPFNANIQEDK